VTTLATHIDIFIGPIKLGNPPTNVTSYHKSGT
jgi:hypothetical protein